MGQKLCYDLDGHGKHLMYDDYENGGWKWGSWSIFIIILIAIIAFIWHRNHLHRECEAKELGSLQARQCYDHENLMITRGNQRCDELYMYQHVDPCQVPRCCNERRRGCCDEGYGYPGNYGGYGNYGGNCYGNCGGYGYPGPGFLVNGCPPYQVPETKFKKTTAYKQCGHSDIEESVLV